MRGGNRGLRCDDRSRPRIVGLRGLGKRRYVHSFDAGNPKLPPGDFDSRVGGHAKGKAFQVFQFVERIGGGFAQKHFAQMRKFMELDIIEIIPLAFMRGRTLNEAAIICDEAQNTSGLQMLMVLTRLGHGSKMIITGDVTQVDLAANQKSGMVEAIEILGRIGGIGVVELSQQDIVRHRLVQDIVEAYRTRQEARGRTGERGRSW